MCYSVTSSMLDLFQEEFWKDKRKLEIVNRNTILKHYDSIIEQKIETSVIEFLRSNGISNVPQIIEHNDFSTLMTYEKGMRVFNFLVVLDKFYPYASDKVIKIRNHILTHCIKQQKTIQLLLKEWNDKINITSEPYPFEKLETVIDLLSECLKIKYNKVKMQDEKKRFCTYWYDNVSVPFRDATTKNMIINNPLLYLDNFDNEEERELFIFKAIKTNAIWEFIDCPIVDIDFSSCIHLTTIEDDIISLKFHERTWNGDPPIIDSFRWNWEPNEYRIAMTLIMRFLRFGGRKAAYKLLHNDTYNIRFKYDSPTFYFRRLPIFVSAIENKVIDEYNELFRFINSVLKKLEQANIEKDYFKEDGRCEGELAYGDVFPA